jgi:hypothetical protein
MFEAFKPDAIFRALIAAMGLTQAQIQDTYVRLTGGLDRFESQMAAMEAEKNAFKAGSARVVADFAERLKAMELKIDLIALALRVNPVSPERTLTNGHDNRERHDDTPV